jgi:hypothetical protein
MCLPHRCLATSAALTIEMTASLMLLALASAGMYLPSRCLAMKNSSFHASCHNIYVFLTSALVGGESEYPWMPTNPLTGAQIHKGN